MTESKKPRVVLLSPSLEAVSGVSTHVNMLLGSELKRDFELRHFQIGSEGRREGALAIILRLFLSPFQLAVLLLREHIDILHINTSLLNKAFWRDTAYLWIARIVGCKVVFQVHGGALPQVFYRRSRLLTNVIRYVLRYSNAVVVLSRAELVAYQDFDERISVHLIPNAVDAVSACFAPRSFNSDSPLRLVYVGRLAVSKGLVEMIRAVDELKEKGVRSHLNIAGSGNDERELRTLVDKLHLEKSIEFLGPVFGEAKNQLWLNSDVFVFPTYREGLPYSILEAMSMGCVPVTCPVGAIPDVVKDGVHGIFVPTKDVNALAAALIRLDRDRDILAKMAEAARIRIASNYSIEKLADNLSNIYRSIIFSK